MSTLLAPSTTPVAASRSMASEASTTRSKASPSCTRRAASTPPTDSKDTAMPLRAAYSDGRSSATSPRVAIDEMP